LPIQTADRILFLEKIFKVAPSRLEWMGLPANASSQKIREVKVTVLRNTTFETVAMAAQPLLAFWSYKASWTYSSYDASFPEVESLLLNQNSDLVVLWIDWGFLETHSKSMRTEFIQKLFARIRNCFSGPVTLNLWTENSGLNAEITEQARQSENWILFDLEKIAKSQGISFLNTKSQSLTTSCFSKELDLILARTLSCSLIPTIAGFQLRGLILDLDHTMYQGLLGEDGPKGVKLTEGHLALWQRLRELKEQGILLAIASKNNLTDVQEFLAQVHVPLKADDFAVIAANWESKAQSVGMILDAYNFSPEFVLFLDDNPNELISVGSQYPELNLFKADPGAAASLLVLKEHPGLLRLRKDESAALRTKDIQANFQRAEIASRLKESKLDYLKELQLKIEIIKNQEKDFQRVADLAAKTNQFNLTFHRSDLNSLHKIVQEGGALYSVSLSDRFSDSGIVGSAVFRKKSNQAFLEEFLFSCRALGREAETFFLQQILSDLKKTNCTEIEFKVVRGPKNQPALEWLSKLGISEGTQIFAIGDLEKRCGEILKDYPAQLTWSNQE
jgi:FkbH-like protein